MPQSRLSSFVESLANVAIGFGVALVSQIVVFPWFGIQVPLSANLGIGAWFTAISVLRSYLVRRFFENKIHATAMRVDS